jgi:hypothetical protein
VADELRTLCAAAMQALDYLNAAQAVIEKLQEPERNQA